jgi:branched-chain amino acid transport system substrate-binding protein
MLADRYGFALLSIPVGLTEMQNQTPQWEQIGSERPDFVLLWGWGPMNAGALSEAVKTGYPMSRLLGVWWSGHDADLLSLGEQAKGYRVLSWNMPDSESPLMQDVRRYVVDTGKSLINRAAGEADWVFYQRGLIMSAMLVESIKTAQEQFNTQLPNAEQVRWGLANLDMNEARLEELGMAGMVAPFRTSCVDHTGHGGGWMLQWDGQKFVKASDLIVPDRETIRPLEERDAKAYAEAHAPWPVSGECGG